MKYSTLRKCAVGKGLPAMLIGLGLVWAAYAEEDPSPESTTAAAQVAQTPATQTPAAQTPAAGNQRSGLTEPVHRVPKTPLAQSSQPAPATIQVATVAQVQQQPTEHPLVPALRIAKAALANIDAGIQDYSCTVYKRERINRKLGGHEAMFIKVRHKPFSVYMRFLGPKSVEGRECIYVENKNDGKLIAREGSGWKRKAGVFRLLPTGMIAMQGQKYPITEIGVRNLSSRLIEVAQNDLKYGECDVKWFKDTKIGKTNARKCTCLQVTHPVPRKEFRFHMARIYIDDQWQIPIRYEAYLWPGRDGKPILDEEYTYVNFKFNNGFTDEDFEERNKAYNFHE